MRFTALLPVFISTLAVGQPVVAQEKAETAVPAVENVAYEKLKVLEPIIGTWTRIWTSDNDGKHHEIQTTYYWSPGQKTISSVSKGRKVDAGGDLSAQEWDDETGKREYYIWNAKAEQIEQFTIYPVQGAGFLAAVLPDVDNKFILKLIHPEIDRPADKVTLTILKDEMSLKFSGMKNENGEAVDPVEWTSKRVKYTLPVSGN